MTIAWHPNRQAGEEAEKQAIQDENPKHNIHRRKPGQRKDLEQQRKAEQKLAAQRALRARETDQWREWLVQDQRFVDPAFRRAGVAVGRVARLLAKTCTTLRDCRGAWRVFLPGL